MKKCFRCHKVIVDNSNYYSFTEFKNSEIVNVNYAHKSCWDNFLKKIGDTTEAMNILKGLKQTLTKMGALPEEEVIIE